MLNGKFANKPLANVLLCVALVFLVFFRLQFSTQNFPDTDSFYHVKISNVLANTKISDWPPKFPWLPQTVLSEEQFVDHHFLFHVLLAPFTTLSQPFSAKFAAVIFATLAFSAFLIALPQKNFLSVMFATLLYISISPGFLYRMSMIRAQSSSLAILFVLFFLLHKKRYWWASIVTAIYVWLYYAFPLLLIMLGCFFVQQVIIEKKTPWKPVIAVCGGLVFALIVNPYFPYNITTLHFHLLDKFLNTDYSVKVGNEWYPFSDYNFVVHLGPALALTICAIWFFAKNKTLEKNNSLALLLFTLALMVMSFKSRRFVELFPPFAVLLFMWSQNLATTLTNPKSEKDVSWLSNLAFSFLPNILCILIILPLTFNSYKIASSQLKKSKNYEKYQSSAEWLAKNTPENSMVVASDWDEFTRLFYFNSHNVYLTGLDPYLLFVKDRETFLAWKNLTLGKLEGSIAWFMKYKFKSKYLFVSKTHGNMKKLLEKDPDIELAFDGGDSWVYRVK